MGRREELLSRLERLEQLKAQGGQSQLPPGTTGRFGKFTVPLNPKLTGDEMSAVSANEVFTPMAKEIQGMVNKKVFDSPRFGNVGRTYKQWAGSQFAPGSGLLTAGDKNLQKYQSKVKSLRRYVFGEGGKQLTPYESNVVMALIDPIGKSDEQYNSDLGEATKIIETKSRLALGGARSAKAFGGI